MITSTCTKCCKELICIENEVILVHYTDNQVKLGVDAWAFGDLYECPQCKIQIVAGLGKTIINKPLPPISENHKIFEMRR